MATATGGSHSSTFLPPCACVCSRGCGVCVYVYGVCAYVCGMSVCGMCLCGVSAVCAVSIRVVRVFGCGVQVFGVSTRACLCLWRVPVVCVYVRAVCVRSRPPAPRRAASPLCSLLVARSPPIWATPVGSQLARSLTPRAGHAASGPPRPHPSSREAGSGSACRPLTSGWRRRHAR